MQNLLLYLVVFSCLAVGCRKTDDSNSSSRAEGQVVGPGGAILDIDQVVLQIEPDSFIDRKKIVVAPILSDDIQIELEPSQKKIFSFQIETTNEDGSNTSPDDLLKPILVEVKVPGSKDTLFAVAEKSIESDSFVILDIEVAIEEAESGFVTVKFAITKPNATYLIIEETPLNLTIQRDESQQAVSPSMPIRFNWSASFPAALSIDPEKEIENLGTATGVTWKIQKQSADNWVVEATSAVSGGTILPVPSHVRLKAAADAVDHAVTWNEPCSGGGLDPSFGEGGILQGIEPDNLDLRPNQRTNFVVTEDDSILVASHDAQSVNNIVIQQFLDDASVGVSFGSDGQSKHVVDETTFTKAMVRDDSGHIYINYSSSDSNKRGVIKLDPSGEIVSEFGKNGFAEVASDATRFTSDELLIDEAGEMILLVGQVKVSANVSNWDLSVHAFDLVTGSLVSGFGANGLARTFWAGDEFGSALLLESDGSMLVAGSSYTNATDRDDLAVFKFNSDGSLDTSFGTDGRFVIDAEDGPDQVRALVRRTDGFWLAGRADRGSNRDLAIALIDPTGKELAKLNGDVPLLVFDFDGGVDVFHNAIGVPSDGLMAVGVGTFGGTQEGVIVRFNAKGQYVSSFGQSGVMRFKIGALSTQMTGIKEDEFGRYLVTGFYQDSNSSARRPFLARLCAD